MGSHQAFFHLDLVFTVDLEAFVIWVGTGDLVNPLNDVNGNFMPVGSLEGDEVSEEEQEIADRGCNPCSENWDLFKSGQVEAKYANSTWHDTTVDQDVVWDHAVLDTEPSKEAFQHDSNRVKENVEDPKLVYRQNGILHVHVLCDLV